MPSLDLWDRRDSSSMRPNALPELQSRLSDSQQREQARKDRFLAWQTRWADAKGQLIRRLNVIDEQLAHLAQDKRTSPQLTIVGDDFFNEA